MLRLPSQIQRFLSQILGFFVVVSSTLFANWLWQKYTDEIDVKHEKQAEKHHFISVLRKVIEETEYNCTDGIGDVKCPFKLEAHHELLGTLFADCLPVDTATLAKEILRLGSLCNGGRTNRKIQPLGVKTKSHELRESLHKLIETELVAIK